MHYWFTCILRLSYLRIPFILDCKLDDGSCVPVGEKWEKDCITYVCQKESDTRYSTKIEEISRYKLLEDDFT